MLFIQPGQFGEQQEGEAHSGAEWRPIKVRDRPAEGMALLSHSVTDEEAARLAARHGCTRWQGTDSSLKFCLIAEGRFDAYPRSGPTSEWDTAAGQCVLEAAGGAVLGAVLVMSSSSRRIRFDAWLNPDSADPMGVRWQYEHGTWALASGGLFGTGLGRSKLKWSWIPEVENDFIFAIIAEE